MSVLPLAHKSIIRSSTLTLRENLSAQIRATYSNAIQARLLHLPAYRKARVVLAYMNIGAEFASEAWVQQVLAEGKKLVLPRVNPHSDQLDLYWVEDTQTQLAPGLWGIREPLVERCERLTTLNKVEFALLPGVAFTRDGARLGYGGGYYDKLLAGMTHRPTLVAGAFALQLVERIPQEKTDVKVDWIVTESETIDCSAEDSIQ